MKPVRHMAPCFVFSICASPRGLCFRRRGSRQTQKKKKKRRETTAEERRGRARSRGECDANLGCGVGGTAAPVLCVRQEAVSVRSDLLRFISQDGLWLVVSRCCFARLAGWRLLFFAGPGLKSILSRRQPKSRVSSVMLRLSYSGQVVRPVAEREFSRSFLTRWGPRRARRERLSSSTKPVGFVGAKHACCLRCCPLDPSITLGRSGSSSSPRPCLPAGPLPARAQRVREGPKDP